MNQLATRATCVNYTPSNLQKRNKQGANIRHSLTAEGRSTKGKTSATRYYISVVLHCFVLYCIYIFIKRFLRKRFQYDRPVEKRAFLRERKEALRSSVNKVDRVEGRIGSKAQGQR